MEIDEIAKYIPKVNLISKNKTKPKLLRVEKNDNLKNNNLKYVNISNNNKKQQDIIDSMNNDNDINKIVNKNKEKRNLSKNYNQVNINKNISFKNNDSKNSLNDGNKYKDSLYNQKNFDSNIKISRFTKDKENINNKSSISKDNISFKTELNENNSIFNEIISRFKKFNENYKKFIKHTTESNMFNYNTKTILINKSIDFTGDNNYQKNKLKLEIEKEKDKIKLIKVNHVNKNKNKKNKTNYILNHSLNKKNNENEKRNRLILNTKEILLKSKSNKKEGKLLSRNKDILINKIESKKNIKNKYVKSRENNISHNKHNSSIFYKNNNKTINYIPIDYKINSEKREFRTNRLFMKNKAKNNTSIKNIEIIHRPIQINMEKNKPSENSIPIYNKTVLLNKVNIYNKINNHFITKKITFPKEKLCNSNSNSTLDNNNNNQQITDSTIFYNTNSSINYNCLAEMSSTSENYNTTSNSINQMPSAFALKRNNIFRINENNEIDALNMKERKDYIKITENKKMKECFENSGSFFERKQNRTQKNINQKMNVYIKPLKSKSKNKNKRNNFSKEKLLYIKKNNLNNLTSRQLYKLNNSIESSRNIEDENNYIKKPIIKKVSEYNKNKSKEEDLEIERNINKTVEIKCKDKKVINDIELTNIDNESYLEIKKDIRFCRYKRYYNYYLTIPINKICFINKKTIHIPKNKYIDFSNNKHNGYEIIINPRKNMSLDLQKNGKDDIKEKSANNSFSKNNSLCKIDKYKNDFSLVSNKLRNNFESEKLVNKMKRRSITEEKFALGCSKLNKILLKNSNKINLFNGLGIDSIDSQIKINNNMIEEQNNEINNINNNEKENGGIENKYMNNFSMKYNSDKKQKLNKNKNIFYELKELEKEDKSKINEFNNQLNTIMKENDSNELSKRNKTGEYFYNLNPNKKPKNKKKSSSIRKINLLNEKQENKKEIIIDKYIYEQVDKDLENYLIFFEKVQKKEENSNSVVNYVYNWKTIDDLMISGKTKLEDIIKIYIEICKNKNFNKDNLPKVIKYIQSIIEYYIADYSKNQIEIVHLNMIEFLESLFETNPNNSEIFSEILGNLLFILLKHKLYFMKDLNTFIEKTKEIQINIAKVVKYSILASGKFIKQYHNDFKFTKLFNNNDIFVNYVTNEIPELKKKI